MDLPIPAPVLGLLVRVVARWTFASGADWPVVRRRVDLTTELSPRPSGTRLFYRQIAGLPVDLHVPRQARSDVAMLYLHGGGFATGSRRSHRALVARLAHAAHMTAFVPDYRLAPEHPCPAAFEDVIACYRDLVEKSEPRHIVVAGDSAGAALALMLAIAIRDELDLPEPAALVMICPPVDFDIEAIVQRMPVDKDPVLTVALLRRFLTAYTEASTDTGSLKLPSRSLAGLPPLIVDAAGLDPLLEEARALRDRAHAQGVPVNYAEHPGAGHVFHVMAGLTTHANRAVDNLGRRLTSVLAIAATSAAAPTDRPVQTRCPWEGRQ